MSRNRRPNYEEDNETFSSAHYQAKGWRGVAWNVYGWETEPDEDTEWSGCENRTGRVVAVMVGDDRRFTFDPDELKPLGEHEFCHSCGQIGCTHNVPDLESES